METILYIILDSVKYLTPVSVIRSGLLVAAPILSG